MAKVKIQMPDEFLDQLVGMGNELDAARPDRDGNLDVKVGFSEGRGDVSNAMLANVLEYGKHGQPPRPFLKQTKSSSRKPCIEAMQASLKEELGMP